MNALHLPRQLFDVLTEILTLAGLATRFPRASGGADFEVEIEDNGIRLAVQCEKNPRPSRIFPPSDSLTSGGRVPVLAIPVAGKRMQETLLKLGWNWVDLAGNCRLAGKNTGLIATKSSPASPC